jgi:hypothetical protein
MAAGTLCRNVATSPVVQSDPVLIRVSSSRTDRRRRHLSAKAPTTRAEIRGCGPPRRRTGQAAHSRRAQVPKAIAAAGSGPGWVATSWVQVPPDQLSAARRRILARQPPCHPRPAHRIPMAASTLAVSLGDVHQGDPSQSKRRGRRARARPMTLSACPHDRGSRETRVAGAVPRRAWLARSRMVPAWPASVRIQTAPAPPASASANGLSPTSRPGPETSR